MKIAVSDLHPNPFRHLERYPINQVKVDALVRSIKDTDFWDNLLVRKAPNGDGYEIAYGHHRLRALKQARVTEIDVPVRKLDDTAMARIMAHENMEEWGHSAEIEQETVRAVIEGFAEGRIQLPKVKQRDGSGGGALRVAPYFGKATGDLLKSPRGDLSYTADSLADFLGWKQTKVEDILSALAALEANVIEQKDFQGLTTRQAKAVVEQVRHVERQTGKPSIAKEVGHRLAAGMKRASKGHDAIGRERKVQDVTIHNARRVADQMIAKHVTQPKVKHYTYSKLITELTTALADLFPGRFTEKLDVLVKDRNDIEDKERNQIARALHALARRAESYASKLEVL